MPRPATIMPISRRDARILAATIHYEAASEPVEGMAAVAQVALNRAQDGRRGWVGPGAGPVERACMAPWQFSCWNGSESRARRMRALFVDGDPDRGWVSDDAARWSRDTLRAYLSGKIDTSAVRSCSHYINPKTAPAVGSALTGWASRWREGERIGRHVFLRPDQLTPPESAIVPVHVGVPVVDAKRVGALVRWMRQYGRRAWSLASSAATALFAGIVAAWDEIVDALTGLTLPTLSLPPWWPYAALGIAAVVLIAILFIPEKKEPIHERETDGRIDSPDRRGGAGASGGQPRRPPQPAPAGRGRADVLAPVDPRRRWSA